MKPIRSKLILNVGSMFSGKSTELQRQGERHILAGHDVIFLKPDLDTRYGDNEIVNHKGVRVVAKSIPIDDDIRNYIPQEKQVILIDEVQFFDTGIILDIARLLESGKMVYCSGLNLDYLGAPFEIVANLMAMADTVNNFHAVCSHCGEDAVFSAKLEANSTQRLELGEKDKYIPLCRECYYKFMDN